MKKKLLFSTLVLGAAMMLPSCTDNDYSYDLSRPTALVTVCPDNDGSFVMQLDDNTRLIPTNVKTSPFGAKEVRALVNYTEVGEQTKDVRNVQINWLDSIRTKQPVQSLGEQNDREFGHDPIEVVNDWVTIAEDGYLTLRIRTLWGNTSKQHVINLLTGLNPENPFELELRHDAKGDINGRWGDALVAFNLNKLPRENNDTKKITLKWKSFTGDKTTTFEIKMRPIKQDINQNNLMYSSLIE